jgi:hypothetical protein
MLIGNPIALAVRVEHAPPDSRHPGHGRICVHAGGVVLGDFSAPPGPLFDAIDRIVAAADALPEAWDPAFAGRSPAEVFATIDTALRGGGRAAERAHLLNFDFLTGVGAAFADFRSAFWCAPDGVVHLPFVDADGTLQTPTCRSEVFVAVAARLQRWFADEILPP